MFYYQSEVCTKLNVPFSWEVKPGVCKVTDQASGSVMGDFSLELPRPPPCSLSSTGMDGFSCRPSSPCLRSLLQPWKSSFRMGVRKDPDVDPFLAAYKRCTKNSSTHKSSGNEKDVGFIGKRKIKHYLSCKHSCTTRKDNLVRISRLIS
ncbi:hypothetical protein I3842_07G174200 [Carya illinoinensis]|uniref:Uncharacterized protein n=1 Tax=Carya illinoinensis TaxID=32201 RepID=A0A922EMK3_CARIL|nr:hypothetical protein I3842_07G174200 [Carya illinoinensis]